MKHIVGAAAAALIIGGVSIALAQGPKEPSAPGPRAMPERAEPKAPPKDAIPDKIAPAPGSEKKAEPDIDKDAGKSTEAPKKGKESGKVAKDKDNSDRKATEPKTAAPSDSDKSPKTGTASDRKDSSSTAASPETDKAPKSGEAPRKGDMPKAATSEGDAPGKTADPAKGAKKDEQITEQQRTTVREKLASQRSSHVTKVKFSVSIGARVPRNVTLYPVPADVITVVPSYRSYRYVWVDDQVVFIDPETYVVITVVDGRPGHAGGPIHGGPRFSLNDLERGLVIRHVVARRESARIGGLSLEVGGQVPDSIRLIAFPDPVITEIPRLRDYRYVLIDDEIAIVDPRQSVVVLKIEQ